MLQRSGENKDVWSILGREYSTPYGVLLSGYVPNMRFHGNLSDEREDVRRLS